ncbi:MAG: MBL fold metallo-hydrolase [Pseudomonadota bacterium]
MKIIRIPLMIAGVLVLGALLVKANQRSIGMALLERVAHQRIGESSLDGLPDGLHVVICGSSSPMPAPNRAGPCVLVQAGEEILVFDAGAGSARQLGVMGVPVGDVDKIFLTHLHSDHIDGLGEMILQSWAAGSRPAPMPVYGPVGTAQVVDGFNQAYELDAYYRIAHHGAEYIRPDGFGGLATEFSVGRDSSDVVYRSGDLTVTAFSVNHAPVEPAVAFRIDYKDRRVTISGDTTYYDNMIEAARDADLLVQEALQRELIKIVEETAAAKGDRQLERIAFDIQDYHVSPEEGAQMATAAGAKHLAFYHLTPPPPARFLYPAFLGDAAKHYSGPITITEDGMLFIMPAGTDDLRLKKLM